MHVSAGAVRSGFDANAMLPGDDESIGPIPLGLTINYFGTNYSSIFINNNGNITFTGPLRAFTPVPFGNAGIKDNGLTAPHELGHQFGIDSDSDDDSDKIMSAVLDPEPVFTAEHIHLIRCRVKSPGQS